MPLPGLQGGGLPRGDTARGWHDRDPPGPDPGAPDPRPQRPATPRTCPFRWTTAPRPTCPSPSSPSTRARPGAAPAALTANALAWDRAEPLLRPDATRAEIEAAGGEEGGEGDDVVGAQLAGMVEEVGQLGRGTLAVFVPAQPLHKACPPRLYVLAH